MASSAFDLTALTLSNPVAGAKGAKTATLSYQNKPIIWQPDAQTVAFEPTAYQNEVNATRVNLVMRASLQTVETLTELDEHMINICTLNSENLFGRSLSSEDVKLRYSPCLKKSDKYDSTFKAKINLSGKGQLKCWDGERKPRDAPATWIGSSVQPRIALRCIWIMPKEFGCLFECSDVLIGEATPENVCPF